MAMTRLRQLFFAAVATPLVTVLSSPALAQRIGASAQGFPERIVGGQIDAARRPQNLNPLGVNGSDCARDMTLEFTVVADGFDGREDIQVWGSLDSDCQALSDRGIGSVPACWLLATGANGPVAAGPTALTFDVRVQDLVGPQQSPPNPPTYVALDATACSAQRTPAAVPMNINFLPVDASGNVVGMAYQYTIITDLVGPPAPLGAKLSVAGGNLLATWIPNTDADTKGYDVLLASAPSDAGSDAQSNSCPPPGLERPIGFPADAAPGTGLSVADPSASMLDVGPAQPNTRNGVFVAAVDGSGNPSADITEECDTVGPAGPAALVGCGCELPGARRSAVTETAIALLALSGAIGALLRRRVRGAGH
jgi:hypothetical protein